MHHPFNRASYSYTCKTKEGPDLSPGTFFSTNLFSRGGTTYLCAGCPYDEDSQEERAIFYNSM